VHLAGFIIRNISQCTVTWTSNSINPCYDITQEVKARYHV